MSLFAIQSSNITYMQYNNKFPSTWRDCNRKRVANCYGVHNNQICKPTDSRHEYLTELYSLSRLYIFVANTITYPVSSSFSLWIKSND